MAAAALPVVATAVDQTVDVAKEALNTVRAFMEKPLFSNASTMTVTHKAKNGDIITRTTNRGWTVSNGMALGVAAILSLWEAVVMVCQAFQTAENDFSQNAVGLLGLALAGPAGWEVAQVVSPFLKDLDGNPLTLPVHVPPSLFSTINQIGVQGLLPILAAAQGIGNQGTLWIQSQLNPQ